MSRTLGSKSVFNSNEIIFFDNDAQNVDNMSENVDNCRSVLVDDTEPYEGFEDGEAYMNSYLEIDEETQTYNPDKYNLYAHVAHNIAMQYGEEELICNGITQDIYDRELVPWLINTKDSPNRIAVFDWDRTISIVEGLIIPGNFPFNGVSKKKFATEMALYVLGREIRIQFLKNMFEMLHENGVKVYILTNNSAASINQPVKRSCFLEMIKIIDPQFVEDNLLCSNGQINKSTVFNNELTKISEESEKKRKMGGGGARKKKTNKRRKQKKQSKRRRKN
jgi:hypothetical protein